MLTFFLAFSLGCNMSTPAPTVDLKPIAPKTIEPRKKPRNASAATDTGGTIEDLIREIDYKPERPTPFADIEVVVDVERGDAYVDIDVSWRVNDKTLIAQTSEVLPHRYFEKGDAVTATVTVTKGDEEQVLEAHTVIVANTPPRILTNPNTLSTLDGFRVRAEDPDGGRVTYHLKGGPPGMSLGEKTGVVSYKPSKTAEGGGYGIVIIARDEDGAESEWRFSIDVSPGSDSETAKAERATRRAEAEAAREAKRAARTAPTEDD